MNKGITMELTNCSSCGITFEGEDIFEHFLKKSDGDKEYALKTAGYYGWSEQSKVKFVINRVYVKTLNVNPDYHECKNCGHKVMA